MNRGVSWPALWLGLLGVGILYVPVTVMVVYSFNSSRLVSVWAGFSTKWYGALLQNDQVLDALGKSIWVAVNAATLSTIFGVLIALAFVRYGNFRFRLLLSALASTPLVMPEVVTGLSLLLLFIAMEGTMGWPAGRGIDTIIIATPPLACVSPRGGAVAASRFRHGDRGGGRRSWRDPALHLLFDYPSGDRAGGDRRLAAGLHSQLRRSGDRQLCQRPGSSTLPIVVFSKVRLGVTPEINALATIMILLVAASVIAASAIIYRNSARRKAAAASQ